jgi:hypothetical protein
MNRIFTVMNPGIRLALLLGFLQWLKSHVASVKSAYYADHGAMFVLIAILLILVCIFFFGSFILAVRDLWRRD